MTTQAPAGGGYPTSPPWAPPTHAPAPHAAEPHTRHGQLMVPYPELMDGATGTKGPSWVPVVVFTFLFSIFGAISAARRADRAARQRKGRHPYWIAFGVTLVAGAIIWNTIAAAVAVPVYLKYRDEAQTKAVQTAIVGQKVRGGQVTKATCTPLGDEADGKRTYSCKLVFTNGRTGAQKVVADLRSKQVRAAG